MHSKLKQFTDNRGLIILLIAAFSTIWLASSDQLNLYIHPRYIIFSAVLAAIGFCIGLVSIKHRTAVSRTDHHQSGGATVSKIGIIVSALVALYALVTLLVFTPSTLTTATVESRGINSSISGEGPEVSNVVNLFGSQSYANFTIRDWAALLNKTKDPTYYSDKSATISGFITPDPDDPENSFYISRFVLTCCAVDAQPIGVPVHSKDWKQNYKVDQWIEVKGQFEPNKSKASKEALALVPTSLKLISQPKEPYVY